MPLELVSREVVADAPNRSWVAVLTYVATWVGFVYVAFVIDVFSRALVGWRVSSSLKSEIDPDALEQAIWARKPGERIVRHGVQHLSIAYTERLTEAAIESSVGSVGSSKQK